MLYKTNVVNSCVVRATDGELGKVKDLYFDSEKWVIRYLVIDTLKWLPGRKVLVSPSSFDHVDLKNNRISILATTLQIENSPSIEEQQPLSRINERELHSYYGWAPYWVGTGLWGLGDLPSTSENLERQKIEESNNDKSEANLRSIKDIKGQLTGYTVMGSDKKLGNVVDFIIDDHSWAIHSIIVDTGSWLPGRKVAISTDSIKSVDWLSNEILTNLTSIDVENNSSEHDSVLELDEIPVDRLKEKSYLNR